MSDSINFSKQILAIGIGGMIGATLRYAISLLFMSSTGFPYATLIANLIGCFLLSFLLNNAYLKSKLSQVIYLALGTGMIGSFTTFSTFAVETIHLSQTNLFLAGFYIFLSVIGGLISCYLGFKIAQERRERK